MSRTDPIYSKILFKVKNDNQPTVDSLKLPKAY